MSVPSIFMGQEEVPTEAGEKVIIICKWMYDAVMDVKQHLLATADWLHLQ